MNITRTFVVGAQCAALALAPVVAQAGSMGLTDFGTRASGRAAAMVATTEDPSAVHFNPANITTLPGLSFDAGLGIIMPRFSYTPVGGGATTTTKTSVVPVPLLSATYNFGGVSAGGTNLGDIALGFGIYAPMGSGIEWPDGWAGRQDLRALTLAVIEFNPVLAWRPIDKISIGGGFRYLYSTVSMSRAVSFGDASPEGSVKLGGDGYGLGYNLGVGLYPTDFLTFGFSYRSGPTLKLTGRADFDFPEPFDTQAKDAKIKANIDTAQFFNGGFSVKPCADRLTLAFDLEWQGWSRYKDLTIQFPNGEMPNTVKPVNSKDTVALHFGVDFKATESLGLRAGYTHDPKTVTEQYVSASPPDSTLNVVALGASYVIGDVGVAKNLGINAYFEDVFFSKRTAKTARFPGTWSGGNALGSEAYLFGIGVSGHFATGSVSQYEAKAPAPASPRDNTL